MDEETKEALALKTELKRLAQEREEEDDSYKDKVTDFDSIKQDVRDALLGMETREKIYKIEGVERAVEEVRTTDGVWVPRPELPQEEKEKLMEKGWMNEEGAQNVINILNLLANEVVGLSDLREKEAGKIGYKISVALTDQLEENMDKYDIDSYEDLSLILDLLDGIVASVLGGSRQAAKLKHLEGKEQVRRIETSDDSSNSRIRGLFS